MAPRSNPFDPAKRFAEKDEARRIDVLAVASGAKVPAQLKRENEAFAFPQSKAQINLQSARALI